MEGVAKEEQAKLTGAIKELAEADGAKAKAAGDAMKFAYFTGTQEGDNIAEQLRDMTELGEATAEPQLLLLNIPDNGGFYAPKEAPKEVTCKALRSFLEDFE